MDGQTSNGGFPPTRWTLVLTAGRSDTARAQRALSELCAAYWYPLYAFVRRRGHTAHDAQDLTQAFFARLLEKHALADLTRERGRFRSFLLAALKNFLVDEWRKGQSAKRGGGCVISLDAALAEARYSAEPCHDESPDRLFDRQWALSLLEGVLQKLQQEYAARGQDALFDELRFCLAGERSAIPYAQIAARLGLTESAFKVAVHRGRQRYRTTLREEIAQTVDGEGEIEEELRFLFSAFSR